MHRTRFCHWLLIFYGALEILLFSGLVFGWGSLVYVLKQEGYMSDVCAANKNNFTAKSILTKQAVEDFLASEIAGGGEGGNASVIDKIEPNYGKQENDDAPPKESSRPKR